MWIATEDGLNKYDGYKFTTYRHDPHDSTSLSNNNLTSLYDDPSGNLWISTIGGGLNKYNHEKDHFFNYTPDPNNPESISTNVMQQTVGFNYDGKAVLWVGTQFGLNKMDLVTQKFKHYQHSDKGFPYTYIEAMIVDSLGFVWIGCTEGGLYKFDPKTELFTNYQHDPENPYSLSDNSVSSIWLDSSGILWVGTSNGGLNKFDQKKEQFIRYQHDPYNPHSLSHKFVVAIYEDRAGILWVGTAAGGLNRFNRETGHFSHYKYEPGNSNSLGDNTVMCIYEDISSVLWVGTWEGIYKFDPGKTEFSDYKQIPGNPNSLSNSYIWSIYESDYGGQRTLWVGTKTGGLNKLDRNSGKYTHYQHDLNNSKSIPSNLISALFEDRAGILWIGTWGDGLIKFDPIREQFTQYINDMDDPISISSNIIRTIFEDNSGILWIGTQGAGLNRFNRETGKFSFIGFRTQIMQIYEDQSGVLWIAAFSGLKKLDRETEQYTTYWHNPDDPNSISSNKVISIHEDKTGRLWFGTIGGGLNKFNRESGEFISYTMKNGLPNDVINGILEDTQGNLWLSTNNGLSRFNPETGKFRNYDVDDGLLGNQFYPGVCYKSKDGEMFFGGTKGLNAFYPDRLRINPHIPEIVITDFQIFNEPVAVKKEKSDEKNNVYTLPKHISLLEEIELSYRENIFSFEFAALDYRRPQKNKYAYLMEGVDPDWVFIDASRRFATYTNLDPGEYTFKVKGSNNDGLWNEEGSSIKIIITPPWWKTNPAYTFYIFLVGFIVFGVWRFQTNRLKIKHELELEHVHTEKLEEVDQLKSRFFANISHEFRTPLTLILGPIEQMISGKLKGNLVEHYKIIRRNGKRLLQLINQLLDLSKLESGKLKLQARATEILVQAFESLAVRKKITLKFNSEMNSQEVYIDVDKFEKIINNLLSNAFKFTPEHGEILVNLTAVIPAKAGIQKGIVQKEIQSKKWIPHQVRDDNIGNSQSKMMEITITNTGPGIPPDRLDKIFDRFYQVDDSSTRHQDGTGIGLALTKELVELHHGKINVSCRGNGPHALTVFFVSLPITKDNFKPEEIFEEPVLEETAGLELIETDVSIVEDEPPKETIRPSRKSAPLLLIVEDNPDVTTYIRSFLDQDYRIITATNGKEGWQQAGKKYPDLIISDVMMPEMDGFELCQKLKSDENTSHIPVILLTAKADIDSRIEGLEFGADDYISKPFDDKELRVRVKNLIEQRKKLREKFTRMIEIKPGEIAATSMDEQFLKRLLDVFENHISEADYNTESFASEIGMSRSNLYRKIQALTNQSTNDFIRSLRLKRAAQLLRKSTGTVSEIAYAVGFNSPSHFSKIFRQQFGQSPSNFANHGK
jgi:signal transduction histidine kinase/ligand-binding sensor domain-containing protein/CheY-like chemotaxis protein/AraC-like DNA-binding protein